MEVTHLTNIGREHIEQPHFQSPDPQQKNLTIVGIGASAGGLQALWGFFEAIPDNTGMAFVVITHLDPDQESMLPELLQQHTPMPVWQVQQPLVIEPDHIYVIPPGLRILMTGVHLNVEPFSEPRGRRTPIDDFFRSLAAVPNDVVAVILSGTGTDGAGGVKAIKEKCGLLMVQHPEEAQFDGMPRAAIATGLADVVLPVGELAEKLLTFQQNGLQKSQNPNQLNDIELSLLPSILTQVQSQTGHDFSHYRQATLLQYITRRMHLHDYQTLDGYLGYLRHNPEEAAILFNDLLVGVTTFFRAPESWQALADQVIPRLFEGTQRGKPIRVWCIACATGEEAYSMAMLLLEEADRQEPGRHESAWNKSTLQIQIFASDLDERALRHARKGLYPEAIEADLSPERLKRFFVKEGGYYRIRPQLRDMVLFTSHSILYDPPFSRLDLISSRNLLTHLQRPLRRAVLEIYFYALNPGGYLFLDKLDSNEISLDLFQSLDMANHIFSAQSWPEENFPIPGLPSSGYQEGFGYSRQPGRLPVPLPAARPLPLEAETIVDRQHHQALEALGPPSLLVNEDYQLLHLSDSAGRYLQPRLGPITQDLFKLVRPELQDLLLPALTRAFQEQKAVFTSPVAVDFNGALHRVIIFVRPYRSEDGSHPVTPGEPLALVFFLEDEAPIEALEMTSGSAPAARNASQDQAAKWEYEVQRLRLKLQNTIAGYEANNEDLRVSNEEMNSINEENLAAVEELETSREELYSVNEELRTINREMDRKLEEISGANSDLENLIAATRIATLFLDRDLLIQRYTPTALRLFPLKPHDHGRHISALTHSLVYEKLVEDAQRVLHTLTPIEREIQDMAGGWLLARLQPYRTLKDRIDGVVATFVNITELKQTEKALRQSEAHLAQEIAALRRLHQMTGRVVTSSDMQQALDEILSASLELLQADFGKIQLLDQKHQTLVIVAHNGFEQSYLERLKEVTAVDDTTCGRALRGGRRVLVEDVENDAAFKPYLDAAREAGYQAVQSTPLINHQGQILGILSTHYRRPTVFSERDEQLLDLLAYQAANLLERLRTEDKLEKRVKRQTAQVRQLASELVASEQTVRQRIAQSLHDNLQQMLYAAKMQLQFLYNDLGEHKEFNNLIETINNSLNLVQKLAVELSPPVLEEEGLIEALAWLAAHMQELYGLHVTIRVGDYPDADVASKEQRILLYEIVRELLFNVVKHAGVPEAEVSLQQDSDGFRVIVSDCGQGFDVAAKRAGESAGFGLHSIHQRLKLFDGTAEIDSIPNAETRISLFLPHFWSEIHSNIEV